MEKIDLLIEPRWVIPVEPQGTILDEHCVAVHDGHIHAVLPRDVAQARYAPQQHVRLDEHALIPGLVNTHTHAAMSLLRGLADDLPLMQWLEQHIWPAEQAWVSEEFVRDATRLAVAEMLRGGTTCFNDMYFFPEITGQVAAQCGIRATIGLIVVEFPTVWATDAQDYISKGLRVHDEFRDNPLVNCAFAPHAPYTVADAALAKVAMLAEELDIPIHIHVHETADEVARSKAEFGKRPLSRLQTLGLLSSRLIAVHMTQLTDEEQIAVADAGSHVVHCPESNLKLASGFCPVADLHAAGVNIALGTDGAASNNDLDMLAELRTAALLAKGTSHNATTLAAAEVLRMATLNGARALGLDALIGTLEPGKAADIVAVDLGGPETQPVYNPISQIVYAAGRDKISDVWVAGRQVLKGRALTTIDVSAALARSTEWGARIAAADAVEN